jgi:hypothetical protein
VRYLASEIAEKKETRSAAKKDGVFEEFTEYDIKLTNGISIHTDSRNEKDMLSRQAEVTLGGHYYLSKEGIIAKGLSHAQIVDENDTDDLHRIMGCEFTSVFTAGNKNPKDVDDLIDAGARKLPDGTIQKSENNKFVLGKNDGIILTNDEEITFFTPKDSSERKIFTD